MGQVIDKFLCCKIKASDSWLHLHCSERLLEQARDQLGLSVNIFKLGFLGPSRDGFWNATDWMFSLLKYCVISRSAFTIPRREHRV